MYRFLFLHLLLSFLLLPTLATNVYAQNSLTNILVLDSLANRTAQLIVPALRNSIADSVTIAISPHQADYLIKDALFNKLGSGIIISEHARNKCSVSILDLSIKYSNNQNSTDSLIREAACSVNSSITTANGRILPLPEIRFKFRDTIARSSVGTLENTSLPFTQSQIPPLESSFWDEIAEPVIYVSSAALTVFLLFSVRSN